MVRQKFDSDTVFISRHDTSHYSEPIRVRATGELIELYQQGTVELDAPAVRGLIDELQDWLDTTSGDTGSQERVDSTDSGLTPAQREQSDHRDAWYAGHPEFTPDPDWQPEPDARLRNQFDRAGSTSPQYTDPNPNDRPYWT